MVFHIGRFDDRRPGNGDFQLIPNHYDQTGRGNFIFRFCLWDPSNPIVHKRSVPHYIVEVKEDYPDIQ